MRFLAETTSQSQREGLEGIGKDKRGNANIKTLGLYPLLRLGLSLFSYLMEIGRFVMR